MNIGILFILHFIADFLLQTPQMGKDKSEKPKILLYHLLIHFGIFYLPLCYFAGHQTALILAVSNAIIHGLIDWNIWRLYRITVWQRRDKLIPVELVLKSDKVKKEWLSSNFKYWLDHWFGVFLGFDQLLHGLGLIIICSVFWSF